MTKEGEESVASTRAVGAQALKTVRAARKCGEAVVLPCGVRFPLGDFLDCFVVLRNLMIFAVSSHPLRYFRPSVWAFP